MYNELIITLNDSFDNYFRKLAHNKNYNYTNETTRKKLLTSFFDFHHEAIVHMIWTDVEEALYDRCEQILRKDGLI